LNNHLHCLETLLTVCKELNVSLDVNRRNMCGETALHYAATHYNAEACQLLIENGANVNATVANGETVLDLVSQPAQHHHHHHEHDDNSCGYDHNADNMEREEIQREQCIDLIKSYGGVQGVKLPEESLKIPSPEQAPDAIRYGFTYDRTMLVSEERFGGALWADYLQVFYGGKKPRPGYAFELRLVLGNFGTPIPKMCSMVGIIDTVSDDYKQFTATVKLSADDEDKVESLSGEWEATLEFLPSRLTPYVLKKLVPLSNQSKSFDILVKEAHERECKEGRKIAKKTEMYSPCVVMKGEESDVPGEHKVLIGIDVVQQSQIVYYYEDGTNEVVEGSHLPLLFQHLVEKNLELKSEGKEGIYIKINEKEVDFTLADDDHEHDGNCCGHHH
jgi:hypothetical protein